MTAVYDPADAAQFIAARTDIELSTVERFLEARFHYQELNYIVDTPEDLSAEREQLLICATS